MKFNFKLSNIELGDIKIGEVAVETEMSINEMVAIRKESELVLTRMPQYLELLARGARKFEELDEEFENRQINKQKIKEMTEQFKRMANSQQYPKYAKTRKDTARPTSNRLYMD